MTFTDTNQHIIIFSVTLSGHRYSRTDVALISGRGGSRFSSMKGTLSRNSAMRKKGRDGV